MEAGLADIRWDAPWLAPLRQRGEELAWRVRSGQRCCEALNAAAAGVRFVPQAAPDADLLVLAGDMGANDNPPLGMDPAIVTDLAE
ncbi:MAG: hypothetical protein ACK4MJ_08345, partial [Hylemonella sp.]